MDSTAEPYNALVYGWVPPDSDTNPPAALVHAPDEVLPWTGIEEAAVEYRASLEVRFLIAKAYVRSHHQLDCTAILGIQ